MLETAAHKVKPHHLAREACLYVRQSSLKQVETNTESTHRQYRTARSAIALGWREGRIRVIDDDQGRSGASAANRSGFRDLMARIAAGEVGIVLSLEVSRLARNNHDWSQLLQVARIADTLILDEAGVHDPGDSSDKLLLDIKGTISEYELEGIKGAPDRRAAAARQRAASCASHCRSGWTTTRTGRWRSTATSRSSRRSGSCSRRSGTRARRWRRRNGSGPRACGCHRGRGWARRGASCAGACPTTLAPSHSQEPALRGGVQLRPHDPTPPSRRQPAACDAAPRAVAGLHPGPARGLHYLEEYCRNQETLARNAEAFASLESRRAAPREGAALLQSLMVCGRCGQRMSVHYSKARPARNQPARAVLPVPGVLRAPGRKAVPVHARRHDRHRAGAVRGRGGQSRQHRAGAGRAGAGADGVRAGGRPAGPAHPAAGIRGRSGAAALLRGRPANRLVVAAPLERDWNERLRNWRKPRGSASSGARRATRSSRRGRCGAWRNWPRISPACGDAPATGNADRKRLLRLLVEDVTLTRDGYEVIVALRLRGGKALQLDVDLPRPPGLKRPLCPVTLALLDDTLDTHSDAEAADVLNAAGFRHWSGEPVHAAARLPVARSCRHAGTPGAATGPLERAGLPHRQGDGEPVGHRRLDPARVAKRGRLLCVRILAGGKPRPMYKLPPRAVPTAARETS